MGAFTKIPADTFDQIQMDAGVLLSTFDPDNPAVTDAAIIAVTTGGINATCVPKYSDLGEDIDNCPNNTMEMKHMDVSNVTQLIVLSMDRKWKSFILLKI